MNFSYSNNQKNTSIEFLINILLYNYIYNNPTLCPEFNFLSRTSLPKSSTLKLSMLKYLNSIEPPDKPEALSTRQVDSRTVTISWLSSYSGNSPITGYHLQYKTSDTSWQSSQQSVPGTDNLATITGLKPITTYEIRVRAENKLGFSPYSDMLRVTTAEEMPSGPPTDIRVQPLSAHSLRVTFNAPKAEFRNGRLLGYYLGYKAVDIEEHFVFKKVSQMEYSSDVVNEKPMEVTLTNLKRDTKYAVIVQAFNGKGSGPQSVEVVGQTLANDPPKAPTITATNVDFESIEINWAFDASDESDGEDAYEVTGLYVYYKEQTEEWMERQIGSQTNYYRFDGLKCGTQYQVCIK